MGNFGSVQRFIYSNIQMDASLLKQGNVTTALIKGLQL